MGRPRTAIPYRMAWAGCSPALTKWRGIAATRLPRTPATAASDSASVANVAATAAQTSADTGIANAALAQTAADAAQVSGNAGIADALAAQEDIDEHETNHRYWTRIARLGWHKLGPPRLPLILPKRTPLLA